MKISALEEVERTNNTALLLFSPSVRVVQLAVVPLSFCKQEYPIANEPANIESCCNGRVPTYEYAQKRVD